MEDGARLTAPIRNRGKRRGYTTTNFVLPAGGHLSNVLSRRTRVRIGGCVKLDRRGGKGD